MTTLTLQRHTFSSVSTIGNLAVNGTYFCKTLEDADRKLECDGEKIPGQTAIPRGTYRVIIDWSPRFKRELPHVLDVPGFEGIRFHPGNSSKDTEGCILVGKGVVTEDFVSDSRSTFSRLFSVIDLAIVNGEEVYLTVQ